MTIKEGVGHASTPPPKLSEMNWRKYDPRSVLGFAIGLGQALKSGKVINLPRKENDNG